MFNESRLYQDETSSLGKPQKSLRLILIWWFLLFSLAPLIFVTFLYYFNSQRALNAELSLRLDGNAREIELILEDYKSFLSQRAEKIQSDRTLMYYLSNYSYSGLKKQSSDWLESGVESNVSFFSHRGQMLSTTFRSGSGELKNRSADKVAEFFLPEEKVNMIKETGRAYSFEVHVDKKNEVSYLALLYYIKVLNKSGKLLGYVELAINLSDQFSNKVKERLNIETSILSKDGEIVVSSEKNFLKYSKEFFLGLIDEPSSLFDVTLNGEDFGYAIKKINWGENTFYLLVGASKELSEKLREEFFSLFLLVVLIIVFLVVLISIMVSKKIVEPLNDLLGALQDFRERGKAFNLEMKDETELGVLINSFNKMSQQVAFSQSELKEKINELEETNKNLIETRAQLVHSAKMAGLGQLVAGVAHELNNPISFIYSNMVHLRDYTQDLLKLGEVKGSDKKESKENLEGLKEEIDFQYIKEDLPKLITSCEDGVERIRDIVLGLRNFSRLDEASEKQIDIHKCVTDTLRLLQGEVKARVQIHKEFGEIPEIIGSASQLNQVFMNILSNATQAIEKEGDIWIITRVSEEKSPEGELVKQVEVLIRDNGKGMAEGTAEKIFDPFFTTKVIGEGTGLGLSISHGIVENHGGTISVKSALGEGTEFSLKFPIPLDN